MSHWYHLTTSKFTTCTTPIILKYINSNFPAQQTGILNNIFLLIFIYNLYILFQFSLQHTFVNKFYQISNITLFICLIGSSIKIDHSLMFHIGAACYLVGLFFCAISIICFSFPDDEGLNIRGIYQFSRHPMYVSYFACFSGMALLTQSWIMLIIVIIFQISAHWIILSEERWCLENFGKSYENYMKKVRRYI